MPLSKVNRPGLNTGIDDNSDATAITSDSSENVTFAGNVDTADVRNTGDLSLTAFSSNTSMNSGLSAKILLDNAGTGYGQIAMTTGGGGAGTFTGMNIDPNGRVTMPNQPVYSASDSRTLQISNGVLTSSNFYNTPHVNVGNHMNTGTGNFTCPVAGVYRIYFRATHANSGCNVRLQKNGSTINEAYSDAVGSTYSVSSEAVVSCAANDTLRIQVHSVHANGGSQHKQVTFQLLH